jgi:HKD family nuclease
MQVAGVKAVDDAPVRTLEPRGFTLHLPLARQRPGVERHPLGNRITVRTARNDAARRDEALRAIMADVGLRGTKARPVGIGLTAGTFRAHQISGDVARSRFGEQMLDDALGARVVSLAEMRVSNHALRVDEVEGWPVAVVEVAPDRTAAVDGNREAHAELRDGAAHVVEVALEAELRRVNADDDESLVAVFLRPGAYLRQGPLPVDAGVGPELDEHHLAAEVGGGERLRVQPSDGAVERRHVPSAVRRECQRAHRACSVVSSRDVRGAPYSAHHRGADQQRAIDRHGGRPPVCVSSLARQRTFGSHVRHPTGSSAMHAAEVVPGRLTGSRGEAARARREHGGREMHDFDLPGVCLSVVRRLGWLFGFIAAVAATGCGTLPAAVDRPQSMARPPSAESPLARVGERSSPDPMSSGFRLMPTGLYALDARIQLIRRATDSLDIQYYLIENDRTGRLFMRSLRNAALRGVRVRLLVDDLYTAGADPMFRGLAAFENVEVRLFNPFCCSRETIVGKYVASLADFGRLNHRMHNKLMVADGAFAIMGGRNIADEYFTRSTMSNFVDMDVLIAGAVVPRLASLFDAYWNSAQAFPVETIIRDASDPAALQRAFDHLVDEGDQMTSVCLPPIDMLGQRPVGDDLDAGHLALVQGRAVVFADRPAKVAATSIEAARAMTVQMDVMERVMASKGDVVISSPYFIPGEKGVREFDELRKRNVRSWS